MGELLLKPSLDFVTEIAVMVGDPISVGDSGRGLRRLVPILGGQAQGPRLSGTVMVAGADYQLLGGDGMSELDARYVLDTNDGARIYIVNRGIRRGPTEAMERLAAGEAVDPATIYFRTAPRFETASPDYTWLARSLFVATGIRHPDKVVLSIFEVS